MTASSDIEAPTARGPLKVIAGPDRPLATGK
jgi:hypothetical protein